jgi:two-component system nitrogen regulation sensor histidine kinase NtrY
VRLRLRHEDRILAFVLAGGLPAVAAVVALLWQVPLALPLRSVIALLVVMPWLALAVVARRAVVHPLQTLSNLLLALREGDVGFRAHVRQPPDSLGEVQLEVNALAETLQQQRLWTTEATVLLRKVMDAIDVAVFAFDHERKLRLVNRAGEALLGESSERLLARPAADLGLDFTLEGESPRIVDLDLPGAGGRWEARRGDYRQGGLPLDLVVLSNVSRALREEERRAWQGLIRVLSHELNNSLAPIRSIAGSLASLLDRPALPDDWRSDARSGLAVVSSRAEALTRFLEGYAALARLPPPRLSHLELAPLVEQAARLETRVPVTVSGGPQLGLEADADQLEQLLINLLRNAAEASLEGEGGVEIGWSVSRGPAPALLLWVDDEGPGIANPANLFVPFFTTKPKGSGIGLVLARQIAEGHGGTLTLASRQDAAGARALVRLPLRPALPSDQG